MNFTRETKKLVVSSTIWSLLILGASIGTTHFRNDFFEYCTTKAYGFPFPWYMNHCLCDRDALSIPPFYVALNIFFAGFLGYGVSIFFSKAESTKSDQRDS